MVLVSEVNQITYILHIMAYIISYKLYYESFTYNVMML